MSSKKNLQKIIFETVLEEEIRLAKDSLDNQVDAILLRFESDSILMDDGPNPGAPDIDESKMLRRALLIEKPEEEDEDQTGDEDDSESDPEQEVEDQTGSQADQEADIESEPSQPKIDLNKFAGKVARLVFNYPSLLDIPVAIANRARNYLETNYSQAVASEFAEIMERDFEVEMERMPGGEPEEFPIAVGAAASGLGGG